MSVVDDGSASGPVIEHAQPPQSPLPGPSPGRKESRSRSARLAGFSKKSAANPAILLHASARSSATTATFRIYGTGTVIARLMTATPRRARLYLELYRNRTRARFAFVCWALPAGESGGVALRRRGSCLTFEIRARPSSRFPRSTRRDRHLTARWRQVPKSQAPCALGWLRFELHSWRGPHSGPRVQLARTENRSALRIAILKRTSVFFDPATGRRTRKIASPTI